MLIVIATTTYEKDLDKNFVRAKMMKEMKEMKGVCFLFSDTGTEGGWWAMQEDGFIS
jgi:hypothetical protein